KVAAAGARRRRGGAAQSLPLRLELERAGDGVTLTATNATTTPELEYAGTVRPRQIAPLLDPTRRLALAGERLTATYATFYGLVRQRSRKVQIEAPFQVVGELRVGDGQPVRFDRTLGDGLPLALRGHASGSGGPP